MSKFLFIIFTLIAFTQPGFTGLAKADANELQLKDAITMALKNNHQIRAAVQNRQATEAGLHIAASGYYPNLLFEERYSASNSPTQTFMMKLDQSRFSQNDFMINNLNHPDQWNNFRTVLTLVQPLYEPSLAPSYKIAQNETTRSELTYEATKEDTAFRVFLSFLEITKAEGQLKAHQQAIQEAKESLRISKIRNREGAGLRSDVLRAETHLSTAEQNLISAANNLALAKMRLANMIGISEDSDFSITPVNMPHKNRLSKDELIKTALEQRIDLKLHESKLESRANRVKLANSAFLPSLDAFGSYQMDSRNSPFNSDNDAWIVGLNLKWRLFDGFRHANERKRAIAEQASARELHDEMIKEIRYQANESFLRQAEALKRVESARRSLESAQEAFRLVMKRYENSLATMVELLDVQNSLAQTRAVVVESEANYEAANGRIYYTAGRFLKEIMK